MDGGGGGGDGKGIFDVKYILLYIIAQKSPGCPNQFVPGGGCSYMKQTGMLVVSLRDVNFGFWARLGCSGQSANILSRKRLV